MCYMDYLFKKKSIRMQQNVHVTSIVVLMSSLVIHGALQNCVVILGYLLEYATEKRGD